MKNIFFLLLMILASLHLWAQQANYHAKAKNLLNRMTLDEKIGQLNLVTAGWAVTGPVVTTDIEFKIASGSIGGVFNLYTADAVRKVQDIAVKQSRLHIPLIFGLDVIHGHRTIFPIPLGLSCTWDMDLIERTARIAATEASAEGINWVYSPMVDICRDPRWGRISEGSGEDPYLGSLIAKAMVHGYQGSDLSKNNTVMACVKHFALYGAVEAGREYNTVDMSRIQMFQYYMPPYKAAIEAGAGSVMTSFNVVDGIPSSANAWLLSDLLRKQWGFKGLVVTDYTAINELTQHGLGNLEEVSVLALKAGTDMDMVGEGFVSTLKKSLDAGKITQSDIDTACMRILEAKYMLGLFDDPYRYVDPVRQSKEVLTAANRQTAREAAVRSFVLLKNEGRVLPLKKTGTVALIGPMAESLRDLMGTWVIAGDPKNAITVGQGIKNVTKGKVNVLLAKGANVTDDTFSLKRLNISGIEFINVDKRTPEAMIREAVETAQKADVVVVVLGESMNMSGEAASRSDIGLPESQRNLLKELVKTGKPIVLVLISGRPLTLEWENQHCNAILEAWAPGTEAGNAIADVLFGDYNPSGKLTVTFPRTVGQIPVYYNMKNTGRPVNNDLNDKYKSKYLDVPNEPLFPFGYGLSYTSFNYKDLKLSSLRLKGNQPLTATVTVANTGKVGGEEVVQLYISDPVASVSRSVKELKKFKKIMLASGERKTVDFQITPEDLKFYNSNLIYDWEQGEFIIHVGANSRDVQSVGMYWEK